MHSHIRPHTHVVLRLPSGILKVLEIKPNTNINIGKFGTFPANLLLGRPYYLTFEILDKEDGRSKTELRVVPAAELHAEALGSDHVTPAESREETVEGGVEFDIVRDDGEVIMRSNRLTLDDPSRQTLSMEEIEELKKAGTTSGKEIIEKIMASHLAIDEKTSFSLAKYTLRKSRKYLKRFTVLPLDIGMLTEFITEREAYKIMELREESLGLISSWANIHCGSASRVLTARDGVSQIGGGRWLVVDDTGGLVVAALAEKMGILYPNKDEDQPSGEVSPVSEATLSNGPKQQDATLNGGEKARAAETSQGLPQNGLDIEMADADVPASAPQEAQSSDPTSDPANSQSANDPPSTSPSKEPANSKTPSLPRKPPRPHIPQSAFPTNTLTIIHTNSQPNLSLLKYFSFDPGAPTPSHPLYHHLKSVSWLQLLHPSEDPSYIEPEPLSEEVLASLKSSKRGNYYRKRRRWERTSRVVDETRRGGFDGLVVASVMDPATILKALVPLVRGAGRVVVYNPNAEPLVELCDFYSKERRTAYISRQTAHLGKGTGLGIKSENGGNGEDDVEDADDFPVNPTLLLAPTLQTARARHWQVLPGRTHPMMTSRGGAEGYLFTATRVLPAEGKVEARGHGRGKKRKVAVGPDTAVSV
ncbi:Gcd10p-domain-containing protein [Lindgomyces ingoldianus]|uniref:Gcd10p-domain-containing protein n=1 Tax=Lindgomyces ingoldianus TaxID=673940 RepID=A0ACB6R5X0_9PLEO|nr:Gcd10p-domain-containing protein [Lindgomyces ingoldianus]KAF2474175.1 Gcd10p-domain-containing protein [Lindgomyces ingoldianus]